MFRGIASLFALAAASAAPEVKTPQGVATGKFEAGGAVERFGNIPYALPPLGARRFAQAQVNREPWQNGLDARNLSAPCIQNPLGDPRSAESESGPPTEDCMTLNIWRPTGRQDALPVMVYLFGGGLCGGWSGNEYFNGSTLAMEHGVVVVTVNYRIGALGYMVAEDAARPGSGGMNGIYDTVVALQWLKEHVGHFGGEAGSVTLFGQSSGGYAVCTLSVAPAARGLFHRAVLQSGPCIGGPPGRGWGPMSADVGRKISQNILDAINATSFAALRQVPAEQVQWPDHWMNDLDAAPYFSGYFEDAAVVPASTDELWEQGQINPRELIILFNSKDGTGAFYGTGPTLGNVAPNEDMNTPEAYNSSMRAVWGEDADAILAQYSLERYPSAPSAWVQADADAYVICPLRRMAKYAALAGRKVHVGEFAHFQPAKKVPEGCSGWGPLNCEGFGCDNGVELDVVPGHHDNTTKLWASHGAETHYVFGTEQGPDGLGPPFNETYCYFDHEERQLSAVMRAYWASFARFADPNKNNADGSLRWPPVSVQDGQPQIQRLRFSLEGTDGVPTELLKGVYDENCDFWDALYPPRYQVVL